MAVHWVQHSADPWDSRRVALKVAARVVDWDRQRAVLKAVVTAGERVVWSGFARVGPMDGSMDPPLAVGWVLR